MAATAVPPAPAASAWDSPRLRAVADANRRALLPLLAPLVAWLVVVAQVGPGTVVGLRPALVAVALALTAAVRLILHVHLARRPPPGRIDASLLLRAMLLTAAAELAAVMVAGLRWELLAPAAELLLLCGGTAACTAAIALAMDDVTRLAYPALAFLPPTILLTARGDHGMVVLLGIVAPLLVVLSRRLHDDYWEAATLSVQQRSRTSELEHLSTTDALTGLANRLAFDQRLDAEWRNATAQGGFVSVALIDLDRFKGLNDSHGHPFGDQCLAAVAELIQDATRADGLLGARYGGEEFVLLLPGVGAPAALSIAERVRATVAATSVGDEQHAVRLSCSVGVATAIPVRSALPASSLIGEADHALYRAKREGRNCVRAATTMAARVP